MMRVIDIDEYGNLKNISAGKPYPNIFCPIMSARDSNPEDDPTWEYQPCKMDCAFLIETEGEGKLDEEITILRCGLSNGEIGTLKENLKDGV